MTTTTERRPVAQPPTRRSGRWIDDWRPEDPAFWNATGKKVAWRNLVFSVLCEHIGFSIWVLWSVFVLFLPSGQYGISTVALTAAGQKFLLTSLPAALGSAVRIAVHARRRPLRRSELDGRQCGAAARAHGRQAFYLKPRLLVRHDARAGRDHRSRRRKLRLLDDEHQLVLPAAAQGMGARTERRRREPRRRGGAARRPRRAGHRRRNAPAVPARHLHPADRHRGRWCVPDDGQPQPRPQRQAGDARRLQGPAHLGHVVPLHRHVRFVHRFRLRVRSGAFDPVPHAFLRHEERTVDRRRDAHTDQRCPVPHAPGSRTRRARCTGTSSTTRRSRSSTSPAGSGPSSSTPPPTSR